MSNYVGRHKPIISTFSRPFSLAKQGTDKYTKSNPKIFDGQKELSKCLDLSKVPCYSSSSMNFIGPIHLYRKLSLSILDVTFHSYCSGVMCLGHSYFSHFVCFIN